MISCNSQRLAEINNKCDVSETENIKAFDSLCTDIDTTKVFKNKIIEFEKNNTGILFCQFLPNMKYGKFTEIKTINDKLIYYNSSKEKQIPLKNSDIELITTCIRSINKKYYYEQCDEYISNNAFYLILIKREGDVIAKYFTHGNINFRKVEGNTNLNTLKTILEVMYRNSFK